MPPCVAGACHSSAARYGAHPQTTSLRDDRSAVMVMEIYPDPMHVILMTLPFLTAMVGLHLILWKPLLAYLDERALISDQSRHEAHELEGSSHELLSKIDARLLAAKQHISTVRQAARQRALAKEAEIIAETRRTADQRLAEALEKISAEKSAASAALRDTASELSTQIAASALGRSIDASRPKA